MGKRQKKPVLPFTTIGGERGGRIEYLEGSTKGEGKKAKRKRGKNCGR